MNFIWTFSIKEVLSVLGISPIKRSAMNVIYVAVAVLIVTISGCISPYKQPDGSFLITKHTEVRSPFGTNGGYDFLERCQGPEKKVLFYTESDFSNCQQVKLEEHQKITANHKSSQGQGGQIIEGMMNAGALGAVAATRSGGSTAASAASIAVQSVTVTTGKGRGR